MQKSFSGAGSSFRFLKTSDRVTSAPTLLGTAPAASEVITIKETDGSPSIAATSLQVTNGKLTGVSTAVVSLDLADSSPILPSAVNKLFLALSFQ
jgi:hypothetical protein